MTIAVVGGGPTGVELAGAFAELTRHVLKRDFRRIDPRQARVILLEAGPRLLQQFSPRLSAKAAARLTKLGVDVRTNVRVEAIGEGFLQLADSTRIESANIIWAAGVAANPLTQKLGVELDRAGRVRVNPDLSLPGHPEVFAIGDLALVLDKQGQPGARRFSCGDANGPPRRPDHSRTNCAVDVCRPEFATGLQVLGQRDHGDHRPVGGGGADRPGGILRLACLGHLVVHSFALPHRVPKQSGRPAAMDLLVFHLQTEVRAL